MIELDAAARPSCRKLDDFIRKLLSKHEDSFILWSNALQGSL